jgi:hypothetical protein
LRAYWRRFRKSEHPLVVDEERGEVHPLAEHRNARIGEIRQIGRDDFGDAPGLHGEVVVPGSRCIGAA